MVSALDRKLLRDLSRMRGQVITIALVVACGIATYAVTSGTYDSLLNARDDYYRRYLFPDVFATAKRAPMSLRDHLAELPGVSRFSLRLREAVTLPMPGLSLPVTGTLLSAPEPDKPTVGGILLRRGRYPARADEVVLLEAFFDAHHLRLGDRVPVVIDGTLRRLQVVGVAIAPEFLFAMAPGEMMPDPQRYAVLWMEHGALADLLRMEGAFNDAVFKLQRPGDEAALIAQLSRVLQPYGGLEPYGRARHLSESMLTAELTQMKTMARMMPTIFLGVAAFLISIVLGRIVQLQRPQVASLKAVGYSNWVVGFHFLKLVLVIVALGTVLGVIAGSYLGEVILNLYREYFQFPELRHQMEAGLVIRATLISFAAGSFGAMWAVRSVVRLPPAEAMQPEPPAIYRRSILDRLGIARLFGQSARMVLREVERNPMRAVLSALGIAFAVAVLVVGRFSFDAIDAYMSITFDQAMREDVMVTFRRPLPAAALHELRHLPGVLRVEGQRRLPTRVVVAARAREVSIIGYPHDGELSRLVDTDGQVQAPPAAGLMLTDMLAEVLDVAPGDTVEVVVREGNRGTYKVPVVATVREMFGLAGHMDFDALHRLIGEEPSVSMAFLKVDPAQRTRLFAALRDRPEVLGVGEHQRLLDRFVEQTANQMNVTTLIMTLFAAVIAAGVVYNNARLVLSTRSRDLASLRVLGFRRSEISALLLGELALHVLVALLPGMWLGTLMAHGMMSNTDPEQYRFPLIISLKTYVFAGVVTVVASTLSALLVRRKLDHMDLTEVLKTRG